MQVLELGIVVHSVIIGISLGASENPKTIRPLVAALTFHQFFEGMGLGGCIVQVSNIFFQLWLRPMVIKSKPVLLSKLLSLGIKFEKGGCV